MTAVRTDTPSTAPAGRFGGLLRAEAHRFVARRFIQVLLLLAALGWVTATVIGLTQFASATPARLAAAQQELQAEVERSNEFREECLASTDVPADASPDEFCGPPVTAADLDLDWYLDPAPFSLVSGGTAGAVAFGAAGAVLAFLIGATFVGAEWSSRSIVALLFWETRRPRVLGAKTAVVAVASAVLGVVAQGAWLATAGLWQAVAGDGAALPEGFWSELLATGGRGVLLTTLIGLLGFGLTNLVRNTGAALGVGFVYFAVLETAVRAVRPAWQPWLLTDNAAALVLPDGLTLYTGFDPVTGVSTEYLLGNLQAAVFLSLVTAVVLTVGVVLFTRRDLH
ncbi:MULTISPECIES: ABC transporter permease subunit [unclassified Modestobacter]|uniref:ABC transporter permease subunit n=1 Tax=unclassified Modestobacter TaxID=2643866 RepID=UPI0022AA40A7|nr:MULTISPECIES: ABC transporter permease subunit [unclassified Modestobacter]MCZ2824148.1 ABC transporter permease subunit [Modestobacter sp. VKM Ac-2981]MCZ2854324.1 ABC transporter permease subunit [Modestobacter sp. VKM Ac-2982]